MTIISLFGPDGSGKSTLAKNLAERLNQNGFKVRLSWMRGTHTFASLLAKFLSKSDAFKGFNNPYYGITIPRNFKRFWQLLEFASIVPIMLVRFLIPSWLDRLVIAERYIPDFIVWTVLTTNDFSYFKSLSAKFLLALASKAKVKVYVTAEYEELVKRDGSNPAFTERQLKPYEVIAEALNAYKLDTTNRGVDETVEEVLSLIRRNSEKL